MNNNNVIHHFIFFMTLALYVIFTSCKTINTAISTERAEPVRIVIEQDSNAYIPKGRIPILAWLGVQVHTVERYRELKECGIYYNLSFHNDVETLAKAMDVANEAGVGMIIHCPELLNEPEKIVNRFKDHPALVGYYLKDEPWGIDFPSLSDLIRRIQMLDRNHFCYINLFPNYVVSEALLPATTYREHIQLFLQEVPVPFLSFDHYPIRVNDLGVRSLNSEWYENLEIISDETRKFGKPFWAFALTTAHFPYHIPTLADLKLQVYSNLAYGAQGIQYYTYWTPSFNPVTGYHDGPINYEGQKTTTWYTVQEMNKEIKCLSGVFLNAQVIQVRHIAKTDSGEDMAVPTGTTRFNFAQRPTVANIIKTFTIPNNTNAVVSFLKNGNRYYMVVVNRNLSGGSDATFTVTGDAGLQLIQKDGIAVDASKSDSRQIVTPGDALIYGWDL